MMYKTRTGSNFYALLFFLIWPIFSTVIAIHEYKSKWAKNIIWLFTAFFAYSKVNPPGYYSDAIGYKISFEEFAQNGTFNDFIGSLYNGKTVDLLQPFLEYFVSIFTDNYKIYFLIIGLIYGYFYSRNIWFLLDKSHYKLQTASIIIIVIFVLIVPIWNIGGFRFWLATHVFVYGLFKFMDSKKHIGLLLIISTFFIHFSFLTPITVFIIYLILNNRTNLFFILFIFSLFISESPISRIRSNINFLPSVLYNRAENYTSEAYIEKIKSKTKGNWYIDFSSNAIKYSSIIFLIILYNDRKKIIISNPLLFHLLNFTLLFYAISNFSINIPSFHRFLLIAQMLSIASVFLSLQYSNNKSLTKVIYLTYPFIFIFIVVSIRMGFDFFGISTLFGNPLIVVFSDEKLPIIDYIKKLVM